MAFATIDKPSKYFNTSLWTGNDSTQSLSSFGFSPDLVWIKTRTGTQYHGLFDTIRGALVSLQSNTTTGDQTFSNSLTSFDSDGFTLGLNDNFNWSTKTYVGWSWRGSDSSAVSNTAGTISSTVSANTTSGFSIVSWTGTGANGTVGHGLGVTPAMIIVKDRTNSATSWVCWNKNFSNLTNDYILLNDVGTKGTYSNYWGTSAPTSSVFGVGSGGLDNNKSSASIIAYCFAEIKGYSKFGSYIGNGSTDGTFVYTGFKPAMIIAKQSSGGQAWQIHDTARDTFNLATRVLFPNSSSAEQNSSANGALDILSNGFKWRMADADQNGSGSTYIYMAFASNPFVSSKGIPCTAR
jgi:hypothetical protein